MSTRGRHGYMSPNGTPSRKSMAYVYNFIENRKRIGENNPRGFSLKDQCERPVRENTVPSKGPVVQEKGFFRS